ncbi:deoxycytidylate deaminase [Spirosoma linguale]|uniref:CMP/dCMP deaminase zinc-binding protein n=1 Tax=Spirosoma linguale (strain ATCC 33905 / DSM 74 / LMG 10896 / Claus 1) TaxID=504472 RepID=D2QBU3_SPILD|nr:CMP/dCMP deaminase zinc-binding protein [Spirosoma linguale DSM 74]
MLPTTDKPVLTTDVSTAPSVKPRFDDIFMDLAVNLAKRSHCIKAQVGAVLTRDTRIISIGYNGPPAGTHNCDEEFPGVGCPRDSKGSCSLALHAEQNAILYAAKNGSEIEGSTIYVTLSPCIACARIIYSMKIARVVFLNSYAEYKGIPSDEGVDFLRRFGVTVERYVSSSGASVGADLPITQPTP